MRRITFIAPLALVACVPLKTNSLASVGSSIELEPGRVVTIYKVATQAEAQKLGLRPNPCDSIFYFSPQVADLSGPSGICIIRADKVFEFKITSQTL